MGEQLMFDISSGSQSTHGRLSWTWLDAEDDGAPRLFYRQPTVAEYNEFCLVRAKYRDDLEAHIESKRGEVDDHIETIRAGLDDLDDDEIEEVPDLDRWREALLLEGFYPTRDQLDGYLDFAVACTTDLDNIGADGEVIDWSDLDADGKRRVLSSLGSTPDQRVATLLSYAAKLAEGLTASKKKPSDG